jgi:hypothetical protein
VEGKEVEVYIFFVDFFLERLGDFFSEVDVVLFIIPLTKGNAVVL